MLTFICAEKCDNATNYGWPLCPTGMYSVCLPSIINVKLVSVLFQSLDWVHLSSESVTVCDNDEHIHSLLVVTRPHDWHRTVAAGGWHLKYTALRRLTSFQQP